MLQNLIAANCHTESQRLKIELIIKELDDKIIRIIQISFKTFNYYFQ